MSDIRFVRIRGRIVPIRKKLSEGAETLSSMAGAGAVGSLGIAKGIEHRKLGKIRAKMIKKTHTGALRKPVRAALSSSFKFRKLAGRLGKVSGVLGIASFIIAPDKQVSDVVNIAKGG